VLWPQLLGSAVVPPGRVVTAGNADRNASASVAPPVLGAMLRAV